MHVLSGALKKMLLSILLWNYIAKSAINRAVFGNKYSSDLRKQYKRLYIISDNIDVYENLVPLAQKFLILQLN